MSGSRIITYAERKHTNNFERDTESVGTKKKKNSKYLSIDIIRVNIYFKKYIDLLPAGRIFGSLKKQNSGEKMGAK